MSFCCCFAVKDRFFVRLKFKQPFKTTSSPDLGNTATPIHRKQERTNVIGGKPTSAPTKADSIAKLRLDIAAAVAVARQAGIDAREIAGILEQHVDIWRQNDAMLRPVL